MMSNLCIQVYTLAKAEKFEGPDYSSSCGH